MSTQVVTPNATVELLSMLTQDQRDALSLKFAAQAKTIKRAVREAKYEGSDAEQYAVWILATAADAYINSQMRDIWIQQFKNLVPRLMTKDEKLKTQTENAVVGIVQSITDPDMLATIQVSLKKELLPHSTDAYTLLQCFDRLEVLFKNASKK